MTPAARYAAAIGVLDGFLAGEPVEKLLSNWARKNRYAGSKDRAAVRDIVFDCLRNQGRFAKSAGFDGGRALALGHCVAGDTDPNSVFSGEGYAPDPLSDAETAAFGQAVGGQASDNFPDWIADILKADLGADFERSCAAMSERAPVDLRVNISKTTIENAIAMLAADSIAVDAVDGVPTALRVRENPRRVAGSKAFAGGYIELQDAASQAILNRLDLPADGPILDYCAGGGGKTLAMAAAAPNASIDAWDISAARMEPLKERAKRAGARVRVLAAEPRSAQYELVLVDAPCSGAGSWRRNPEGKWRLAPDRLEELQGIQAAVLNKAAKCVKANGTLVYATCSVFARENREQVDAFLAQNAAFSLVDDQSYRVNEPGDGFYVAILKNNSGV
ncbi:RsmB/NOP family class I SAM-dependent RNA methyltransferase [Amylibacter sp. IMCC11727]|uniref:RsmB/NOP family class I SAM-dependent RNA methyltransferase n=1 Tax=Amylibacter sp. IMCC11727 TaxID=3039851 RepID=UPI00244E332C|nr:RsmB/NOP family class I SAM-dependent RNA methyltransferase [Amylibacter sp. IMCC11727]WGI20506.1 RsmB/NOP family class I SAM-dependent RNA methyltransferase [Amylibacter sp. IMCC11727]